MGLFSQLNSEAWLLLHKNTPSKIIGSARFLQDRLPSPKGFTIFQVVVLVVTLMFTVGIRRRYFSPLSSIPGPFLASFSRLWHLRQIWRGDQHIALAEQHEKHGTEKQTSPGTRYYVLTTILLGPFVRLAHNEVSVCHPAATKKLFITPLEKV